MFETSKHQGSSIRNFLLPRGKRRKMTVTKNTRMLQLLNYRLRLTLQDGRTFVGQMIGFDKHMNLVLADCEEFRTVKQKSGDAVEEKRALGLIVLRGNTIVSMVVESPPPVGDAMNRQSAAPQMMANMPGMARPGMRGPPMPMNMPPPGMPPAPMGLAGPMPGMGGPGMRPPMGMPPGFRPGMPPPMMPPQGFRPPPPGFRPPPPQ